MRELAPLEVEIAMLDLNAMRSSNIGGQVASWIVATSALAACGPAPGYFEHSGSPGKLIVVSEPASVDESVFGRWTGTGYQSDGPRWKMDVDIARSDSGPCAVVRYPDYGCSGYWTCTSDGGDTRLRAVEHITDGLDRCADSVEMDVEVTSRGELVVYATAGEITAAARLARASD